MMMVEARKNEDEQEVADKAASLTRFADASAKLFADQTAAIAMFTAYGMSMASQMTGMMLGAMNTPSAERAVFEPAMPDIAKTPSDNVVPLVRNAKPKAAAKAKPEPKAVIVEVTPATEFAGDDLKKIAGVGPRLEKVLHERGIATFANLAGLSKAALKKMDTELGLEGRVIKDDWAGQARALSEGKS